MKSAHLKVHTESTVKYSYVPESFIIITCVLSDIEKTARQYFKTERVVSLKIISHGASFIPDHSIVLFSSISF